MTGTEKTSWLDRRGPAGGRYKVLCLLQISAGLFTPLESPAIHGGDDINKTSIPHRKGGVKATSFLTGFTESPGLFSTWV